MVEYNEQVQVGLPTEQQAPPQVKVPLNIRKNLKDYQNKLNDALGRIKESTGLDFKFEMDVGAVYSNTKIYEDKRNQLGYYVYGNQMEQLATVIEKACKDELSKEALCQSLGDTKTIRYVIADDAKQLCDKCCEGTYLGLCVKNGELWLVTSPDSVGLNNGIDVKQFRELFSSGGLPLNIRKGIRDNEPTLKKHLESIKKSSGIDFKFECDFDKIYLEVKDTLSDINDLPYKVLDRQMESIADLVEKFCKDEMCKEAFQDALSDKKIIRFVVGDPSGLNCRESTWVGCTIRDGELLVITKSDSIGIGNRLDAKGLEKDL